MAMATDWAWTSRPRQSSLFFMVCLRWFGFFLGDTAACGDPVLRLCPATDNPRSHPPATTPPLSSPRPRVPDGRVAIKSSIAVGRLTQPKETEGDYGHHR